MNALELAEKLLDCLGSEERWEIRSKSASMLRQQQAEIEALKLQLHTTLTNRNLEKPAIEEIMAEHCTCYKLGYSPLNDYALVKQK